MRYIITVVVAFFVAIVSAAAQQTDTDFSANSVFPGCKVLVEGTTRSPQLHASANFCSGIIIGLTFLSPALPPEYKSCVPIDFHRPTGG
jgi:hypothetical protein